MLSEFLNALTLLASHGCWKVRSFQLRDSSPRGNRNETTCWEDSLAINCCVCKNKWIPAASRAELEYSDLCTVKLPEGPFLVIIIKILLTHIKSFHNPVDLLSKHSRFSASIS